MELQGRVVVPAASERVWEALNNVEVLRACIPGCEEIQQVSPEEMQARVMLRLGPVRARFTGKVLITDVRPLQGYTLNFEGSGGAAGFATGSSVVVLTPGPEGTQLEYTTRATVAGKLGQIGARLMDASARQLADRFFAAFQAHVAKHAGNSTPQPDSRGVTVATQDTEDGAKPVEAPPRAAPQPIAHAPTVRSGWLRTEGARLLWFTAGGASTALGVLLGAIWWR